MHSVNINETDLQIGSCSGVLHV